MKKGIKIFMGISCILMMLWCIMFAVDYNKCASLERPVFAISQNEVMGKESYLGIGYTVEVETYLDKQYGKEVISCVEMKMFGKVIVGAIS